MAGGEIVLAEVVLLFDVRSAAAPAPTHHFFRFTEHQYVGTNRDRR